MPTSLKQEYLDKGNVPALYNLMKSNHSTSTDERPLVYGLQTIYSASFITLLFSISLVAVMVLTDGLAAPLLLLWLAGWCIVRFLSLDGRERFCDNGTSSIICPDEWDIPQIENTNFRNLFRKIHFNPIVHWLVEPAPPTKRSLTFNNLLLILHVGLSEFTSSLLVIKDTLKL